VILALNAGIVPLHAMTNSASKAQLNSSQQMAFNDECWQVSSTSLETDTTFGSLRSSIKRNSDTFLKDEIFDAKHSLGKVAALKIQNSTVKASRDRYVSAAQKLVQVIEAWSKIGDRKKRAGFADELDTKIAELKSWRKNYIFFGECGTKRS
jgi:hypothetical protein